MTSTDKMAVVAVGGNCADHRPRARSRSPTSTAAVDDVPAMSPTWWSRAGTWCSRTATGRRSASSCAARASPRARCRRCRWTTPTPTPRARIGYMFQRALSQRIQRRGITRKVVARGDTVAGRPRRSGVRATPPSRSARTWTRTPRKALAASYGWAVTRGCRARLAARGRLARPEAIIELDDIRSLVERRAIIVIACGGGGIPVVEDRRGDLRGPGGGDRQGLRLQPAGARHLGAELFWCRPACEKVAIHFNTPTAAMARRDLAR